MVIRIDPHFSNINLLVPAMRGIVTRTRIRKYLIKFNINYTYYQFLGIISYYCLYKPKVMTVILVPYLLRFFQIISASKNLGMLNDIEPTNTINKYLINFNLRKRVLSIEM